MADVKEKGTTPTTKEIQRAYRKACLRCHPDKHPDKGEEFDKVQEAYEILMSIKEKEEEDKLYVVTEYCVTIEKGPRGVGLGLVVAQDPKTGAIAVTKVSDAIRIVVEQGQERPKISPQDIIVGVGDDRIEGWAMQRGHALTTLPP